jgi:hypothetical protein
MDTDDVDIEQFSAQSAAQLEAATKAFKSALDDYLKLVTSLRGGSVDVQRVFDANEVVRREAMRWDDATGDHTGTFPLGLEDLDDDEDAEDEDDEVSDEEPESVYEISIVSRWDLEVSDVPALIEGGRAAHRRLQPEESEEDAKVAIADDDIGPALYALVHERGEPWYDLPGVFVLGGHRDYIDRDGDQPMTAADADGDLPELAPLRVPDGEIVYSESWQ